LIFIGDVKKIKILIPILVVIFIVLSVIGILMVNGIDDESSEIMYPVNVTPIAVYKYPKNNFVNLRSITIEEDEDIFTYIYQIGKNDSVFTVKEFYDRLIEDVPENGLWLSYVRPVDKNRFYYRVTNAKIIEDEKYLFVFLTFEKDEIIANKIPNMSFDIGSDKVASYLVIDMENEGLKLGYYEMGVYDKEGNRGSRTTIQNYDAQELKWNQKDVQFVTDRERQMEWDSLNIE